MLTYLLKWRVMEPINLKIDDDLLQSALTVTGLHSYNKLIELALRELLRRESQKKLLELKGNVEWNGNLTIMRSVRDFHDPS